MTSSLVIVTGPPSDGLGPLSAACRAASSLSKITTDVPLPAAGPPSQ